MARRKGRYGRAHRPCDVNVMTHDASWLYTPAPTPPVQIRKELRQLTMQLEIDRVGAVREQLGMHEEHLGVR